MLVYGQEAKMRFAGVEILDGICAEIHARDNSHDGFVAAIGGERGWPK